MSQIEPVPPVSGQEPQNSPASSAPATQHHGSPSASGHGGHSHGLWKMALGAIGVVYGDIGTSPLYALKESLKHAKNTGFAETEVLGILSLLLWAVIFIVTAKYVMFLMRADNRGEGGILSLMALAYDAVGKKSLAIFLLGVGGAALFSGDAIITPAISVLSALDGLNQPAIRNYVDLTGYILPIAIVILVTLFMFQSRGTSKVAAFFGPVMILFFSTIALLGVIHIFDAPRILGALIYPQLGFHFLFSNGWLGFSILGSVFLAVTGAEALYADMGHFGRKPIQLAWLFFVLPALMLNYFGQGAFVLQNPEAVLKDDFDPFYQIVPTWGLIPMILLAIAATIIASQAVITGAFSIVSQAIQLGLLPRMEIQHTSAAMEGQIFIPRLNRLLLIGVLILVLTFKTSGALANAYGVAVAGTMVMTTSLAFAVVWKVWRWPLWLSIAFIACFLFVDLAFFAANLVKIHEGGWVPLALGATSMVIMWTWVRGMKVLNAKTDRDSIPTKDLLRMLDKTKPTRVPGTAIFLTSNPDVAPSALMHNLKHNKVLHEKVVLMNVVTTGAPRVAAEQRFTTEQLSKDFLRATLYYGFMENPRLPAALAQMRKAGYKYDIMTTSFFVGRRTLKPSPNSGMPLWQDNLFIVLFKQATNAPDFFAIPSDRVVELGAQVII